MKVIPMKSAGMRSETAGNPMKRTGNPHAFRDAQSRGKIQGKLAAAGKPYHGNPYNPDFAQMVRRRAAATIARSNANKIAWNTGFEIAAGFKYKKYEGKGAKS